MSDARGTAADAVAQPEGGDVCEVDDLCEVVITAPEADWLLAFTRDLVGDRLAASAHNFPLVHTVYRWEGRVHTTTEARAAIRTRRALVPTIIERTKRLHPYHVPSIVALPLVDAHAEYAQWVREQTVDARRTAQK